VDPVSGTGFRKAKLPPTPKHEIISYLEFGMAGLFLELNNHSSRSSEKHFVERKILIFLTGNLSVFPRSGRIRNTWNKGFFPSGSETETPEGLTIPPFVLGIGGAAIVVLVIIAAILGRGLIFKQSPFYYSSYSSVICPFDRND
jgi:hypothetical protein